MRAMVADAVKPIEENPLELRELPDPQAGEGQVRVRVECCAICRTDLHVIEGDLPPQLRPIVPGHQIVGRIDQLGPGCSRLQLGQRVGIAWLRKTCGACRFCQTGRENLCPKQQFTGYHQHGGYAEWAVVDEAFAYELPEMVAAPQVAPLLCAGIIGYRALARSRLPRGGRLALYGFGSSAHIVLQIAQHRGAEVYVVTRGEGHRELARRMGAVWVGARADQLPVKVDSAILFAPAGQLVPPALEQLDKGGTLALAGIYMSEIPPLDYERHLFYERNLHSVTANTRQDGRELLDEAARAGIHAETTLFRLEEANRALQGLKHDAIAGTGVLMVGEA